MSNVELLPLPRWMERHLIPDDDGDSYLDGRLADRMREYGAACVEANTEELRAEVAALKDAIQQLHARDEAAEARAERLAEALREIEQWQLPASGRKWDDGSPMSYGAAFGSNGERDYMRSVARAALHPTAAQEGKSDE